MEFLCYLTVTKHSFLLNIISILVESRATKSGIKEITLVSLGYLVLLGLGPFSRYSEVWNPVSDAKASDLDASIYCLS